MQRRLLINLGLLLLIILLSVLIYHGSEQKKTAPDVKLTQLQPDTIKKIQITRKGSDTIELVRKDKQWFMQKPIQAPANEFRIKTLLKLANAYSYTHFVASAAELQQYQLDKPAISVSFNGTTIALGNTSPVEKRRYVLVNNTVHMINDSLYQQLQAPATFFLDNQLVRGDSPIKQIRFPGYTIEAANGIWQIDPKRDTSSDKLVSLVQAWESLTAITVKTYQPETVSNQPQQVIIETEDGKTQHFDIVSPAPDLVLANPELGLEYVIADEITGDLFLDKIDHSDDQ